LIIRKEIYQIKERLNSTFSTPDFLDKTYLPSLDGWRAIAIIFVILGHAKFTVAPNSLYYYFAETFIYAELGVRIFFVLSGFLITTLLIKERIRFGTINIKNFFIKRVLRIFPVLYLYMLVIFILNYHLNLGLVKDNFLGPLLYLNNFTFFTGTWLTGHTWSLAVEEQFYLIWPFLFSVLTKNLWLFCLLMISLVPFLKILYYFKPDTYEATLGPFITNADAIFSGALIAILSFKNIFKTSQKIWNIKGLDLVFILIIFVSMFCVHRGMAGLIFYPMGSTICNVMICLLLIRTLLNNQSLLFRLLNRRILVHIGLLSYSLYIWQQLFIVPINMYGGRFNLFIFPLNIVLAFAAAYLSYNLFEKYFLHFKTQFIKNSNR